MSKLLVLNMGILVATVYLKGVFFSTKGVFHKKDMRINFIWKNRGGFRKKIIIWKKNFFHVHLEEQYIKY